MIETSILILVIPFLGTTLGSAMVFFLKKEMKPFVKKILVGFAAGVMIAASIWSLLIPASEMAEEQGKIAWIPTSIGFLFGIVFLLNMLLRMTWLMAIVYPVVVIFIIDEVSFLDYFFKAGTAFPALIDKIQALKVVDIVVLSGGFGGAIVSGFVMIALRKAGYRMF